MLSDRRWNKGSLLLLAPLLLLRLMLLLLGLVLLLLLHVVGNEIRLGVMLDMMLVLRGRRYR